MVCFSFLLSEQLMFIICRFHMCKNLLKSTPTVLPQSFTDTHSSKHHPVLMSPVEAGIRCSLPFYFCLPTINMCPLYSLFSPMFFTCVCMCVCVHMHAHFLRGDLALERGPLACDASCRGKHLCQISFRLD